MSKAVSASWRPFLFPQTGTHGCDDAFKTKYEKDMKDQLLASLKTKFQGVDDAILDRIAAKRVEGVTDVSQLPAIVEGISFADVLQSYGDYRAGDATQTAVRNYEKRHNLKDGKPVVSADGGGQQRTEPANQPFDMASFEKRMQQMISDAVKPYADKVAGFEADQKKAARVATIQSKAKKLGIDDDVLSLIAIGDDDDIDEVLGKAAKLFNKGAAGKNPPLGGRIGGDKVSAEVQARIDRRQAPNQYTSTAIKGVSQTKN